MNTLTTIAAVATPILALLTKFGDKTTGIRLLDLGKKIMSNKTPAPEQNASSLMTLLPALMPMLSPLLEQLLRKPPPAPEQPLPTPVDTKTPQDLIAYVLSLLSVPTPNTPATPTLPGPVVPTTTIDHEADFAHLVACANAVADKHPDYDISVKVDQSGVKVEKVKRAESK